MSEFDEQYFSGMLKRGRFGQYHADKKLMNKAWANILKSKNVKSILEFGCGLGFFGKYALNAGLDYYGVDISEFSVKKACDLHGMYFGNEQVNQLHHSYDCIVSFDVFEHIEHDEITTLLEQLYQKINRGGLLVFTTPNPDSWSKKYRHGEWFAYKDDTHVNIQGEEYWLDLLNGCGFSAVEVGTDFPWDFQFGEVLGGIQKKIVTVFYKLWLLMFGPMSSNKNGDNLVFIAKKSECVE